MRILVVTNHYAPEVFRVNDVVDHLVAQGHKVTVLTGIPDYPQGHYHQGYGLFHRRIERKGPNLRIIRAYIFPRGKGKGKRLMLNYLTILLSTILDSLLLALCCRFDAVFVHETSPVTIGVPAVIVKKLRRAKLYFWVLDLWPESLTAAGGVTNARVLRFFSRLTAWLYRHSDRILMGSRSYEQSILALGDFKDKLVYFPNWGEDLFQAEAPAGGTPEDELPCALPEGFRIMYAGNLGEAQNFENVLQAALRLRDTDVKWLLVGDGRKRPWIEDFIRENHLEDTVFLLGSHPIERMPAFFRQADAMFLSLKNEGVFALTVPAKLQVYLASARPVLAMIDGEAADVIHSAGCGYAVGAADVEGFERLVRQRILPCREAFAAMGARGAAYYDANFAKRKCMAHLDALLLS